MIKTSWAGIGRVLLVNGGIILVSAWIGVSLNRAFVAGPQQTTYSYSKEAGKFQPVKASEGPAAEVFEEVQLRGVREIISSRSMVPVDGRSEAEYENGHLPGAFSLSAANFDKRFPEFSAKHPKEGAYLIYCGSGQCGLSRQLAGLLQKKGYHQLKLYSAGYNDWFLAGNPIEKGKGGSLK
ncbi:MAG TPA: rhodanese-like domain-containing protein [Terriglobia bacterium]|nr:rhodanese-like domain-containing protein [Terriglobia bacterium]